MSVEELQKIITENTLPTNIADQYLKIYIANIDWKPELANLWKNTKAKAKDEEAAREAIKKTIACAMLLPIHDGTAIPDPPKNLLFWCSSWNQYNEKDWFAEFKKIIQKDIEIKENRNKILSIGVINPIDYSPLTRQAFNWLYAAAEESLCITEDNKEDIIKKFQNLVRIYGGAVICNIFLKHQKSVDKVPNWRSGYFFEKEIYKAYNLQQILKIKSLELSKLNTKYIKKLTKKQEPSK